MRHTYHVEVQQGGRWIALGWEEARGYVEGYVTAMGEVPGPRLAYRAVRDDGRVTLETKAMTGVSIGQVVGFPTAEQYEVAGREALVRAEQIRGRAARLPAPDPLAAPYVWDREMDL